MCIQLHDLKWCQWINERERSHEKKFLESYEYLIAIWVIESPFWEKSVKFSGQVQIFKATLKYCHSNIIVRGWSRNIDGWFNIAQT